MAKKVDFSKEYDRLQNKVEAYTMQVQRILDTFANESTALATDSGYDGKKYFRIDDYPDTKRLFEQLQRKSANDIRHVIINGATALWEDSNFMNDKFAQSILGNKASLDEYKKYFNNNSEALNSFLKRQRNGLNLSQRIWRIEEEFKEGFEGAMTVAIGNGTSAAQLSRTIRQYLREPDKLFMAVNDPKTGRFVRNPEYYKYHPGAGIYRSSYKNAMRLAATEINMAYRQSDQLRWQQMDFIVGYEIKRSGHPYPCPVCEALVGKYPKDFVWVGFHPWCRCRSIPILKTEEEMERDDERILSGKEPLASSVNAIKGTGDGYNQWILQNLGRMEAAKSKGTLPYFIKDNPTYSSLDNVLLSGVQRAAKSFGQKSSRIADQFGAIVTPVNIKSNARIIEKAINDYGGDGSAVMDVLRNTFIANTDTHDAIIDKISKEFSVFRIKRQLAEDNPLGYSGIILNATTANGVKVEMQINSAAMIYGKEVDAKRFLGEELFNKVKDTTGLEHGKGHKWYEEMRSSDSKKDMSRREQIEKDSRKYYGILRSVNL